MAPYSEFWHILQTASWRDWSACYVGPALAHNPEQSCAGHPGSFAALPLVLELLLLVVTGALWLLVRVDLGH